MDVLTQYYQSVSEMIKKIYENEKKPIEQAAELIAQSVVDGKVIHVIGTGGHSYMGAEEIFYRAGGLAPINAILDDGISLGGGAIRSTKIERTPGYAKAIFDYHQVEKIGDVMIITTAVGFNSITIDSALECKKRGIKTIAITSTGFAAEPKDLPARHPSGKNLYEIADIFINCYTPTGDAVVEIKGYKQKVSPISTLGIVYALNSMMARAIEKIYAKGVEPPVWLSANVVGGDAKNKQYVEKYSGIVKLL